MKITIILTQLEPIHYKSEPIGRKLVQLTPHGACPTVRAS